MGAAHQSRILRVAQSPLEDAGDAHAFEFGGHAPRTVDAPGADLLQPGIERRRHRVEGVAQYMHLQAAPLDRDFHAIDEAHPFCLGHRAGLGQTVKVVVVGQGQHLDLVRRRTTHELGRRQQTVGGGGVAVEVDDGHDGQGGSRKTSVES